MTPFTFERRRDTAEPLSTRTGHWVAAGLISPAQAHSIEEFEAAQPRTTEAPPARLGPIAEAAAFVGTVLALIGGGIGIGPQWGDMSLVLRLLIATALAGVGFVAGRWLIGIAEPGTKRLGGFVWVLAASGVALGAGTLAAEVWTDSPWIAVSIGAPVAAVGALLWRNRDLPLQLLTFAVGAAMAAGGMFAALSDLDSWVAAVPVWTVGATAWWVMRSHEVRPAAVARVVAALTMVVGAFLLVDLSVELGAAVALATAAGLIVLALRGGHTPVLVVAVLAALEAVRELVETTFRGPLGGAMVALAGLAIVVVTVIHARRRAA